MSYKIVLVNTDLCPNVTPMTVPLFETNDVMLAVDAQRRMVALLKTYDRSLKAPKFFPPDSGASPSATPTTGASPLPQAATPGGQVFVFKPGKFCPYPRGSAGYDQWQTEQAAWEALLPKPTTPTA